MYTAGGAEKALFISIFFFAGIPASDSLKAQLREHDF